jgi:sarcosine oxidase subunit beta
MSSGGIRRLFPTEPAVRLSVESVRVWERFEALTGCNLEWRRVGYLLTATSPTAEQTLLRTFEVVRQYDVPATLLTSGQIAAAVPQMTCNDVRVGLQCATDGYAGPYEAVQGLRHVASRLGVVILEECEVSAIDVRGGAVRGVQTAAGSVTAPTVVNAAGAWAPLVARLVGLDIPILPVRQHQWVVQLPHLRFSLPCILDLDSTLYIRSEGEHYLVGIGSDEPGGSFDMTVRPDAFPRAAEALLARFPVFESAQLARAWAGLLEMTPDHHPILGPAGPQGFLIAAGFSGHGFMQSPAAGLLIAEHITTGRSATMPLDPFLPSRFGIAVGIRP